MVLLRHNPVLQVPLRSAQRRQVRSCYGTVYGPHGRPRPRPRPRPRSWDWYAACSLVHPEDRETTWGGPCPPPEPGLLPPGLLPPGLLPPGLLPRACCPRAPCLPFVPC